MSGSSAAGMHSMSCLPALAEADVSLEQRWLLQDVAACRCVILALGERPRLPQELCQEVLPWDGVPCSAGAGREGDLVPCATGSEQGGDVHGGVRGASSNNGIFPPPHLDLSDVSSQTRLLVGSEGMCITALANAACIDPGNVHYSISKCSLH